MIRRGNASCAAIVSVVHRICQNQPDRPIVMAQLVLFCGTCGHSRRALSALRSRGLDVPDRITPAVLAPLLPRLKCSACGSRDVRYREAIVQSIAPFVATAQSPERVFHRRNCGWMRHVQSDSEVSFSNRDVALSKGYTPCKSCRP